MTGRDRYVLLGLGRSRSRWFSEVSQWATSGAIPADFAKCLSVAEVRQRMATLQPYSAVLLEAGIAGVERDLIEAAQRNDVSAVVVEPDESRHSSWLDAGAAAVLPGTFSPAELLLTLSAHASIISSAETIDPHTAIDDITTQRAALVTVCGSGGTGASTVAIALAQGISAQLRYNGLTVLADLARNGEQAMLHDSNDIVPGIEELVEMHRTRRPTSDDIRTLTYDVERSAYRLLLGMRRFSAWSAMPPRAVEAAIDGLQRSFRLVIADVTADFEGESDSGSMDVEERNTLARCATLRSSLVVVVGHPSVKGVHTLTRTIREVLSLGVSAECIVPVVNYAPKSGAARVGLTAAITAGIHRQGRAVAVNSIIFVPERAVDDAIRDGAPLPRSLVEPLVGPVVAALESSDEHSARFPPTTTDDPIAIAPGSLGTFDQAVGE